MGTLIKQVKHPYIIKDRKIRAGAPTIVGTGVRVIDIAVRYEIIGQMPEDIMVSLPHITLPQIHDALSYYYEHKPELDREWKSALEKVEIRRKGYESIMEKKLGKVKAVHR
jgi:uncharacterized protein (DUF433 family)